MLRALLRHARGPRTGNQGKREPQTRSQPARSVSESSATSVTRPLSRASAANPQVAVHGLCFASATQALEGSRHAMEDRHIECAVADDIAFFAVIDGHGGAECAAFFAENLAPLVREELRANKSVERWGAALCAALATCSSNWDEENQDPSAQRRAGCVVTTMLVSGLDFTVAHVGDCGVAASLRGSSEGAVMVTRAHTGKSDSEALRIASEGGELVEGRLLGALVPSRAFGDIELREMPGGSALSQRPDVFDCALELDEDGNGYIVLASDGIWDVLSLSEVAETVSAELAGKDSPVAAAKALALKAAAKNVDDITVIIVSYDNPALVLALDHAVDEPNW